MSITTIKCQACAETVTFEPSDERICPNCGEPLGSLPERRTSILRFGPLVFVLIFVAIVAVQMTPKDRYTVISDLKGSFKVTLPEGDKMTAVRQEAAYPGGTLRVYHYHSPPGVRQFTVGVLEPDADDPDAKASIKARAIEAIDDIYAKSRVELTEKESVTESGREVIRAFGRQAKEIGEKEMVLRMYDFPQRVYYLAVLKKRDVRSDPAVKKFFESFTVPEQQTSTPAE